MQRFTIVSFLTVGHLIEVYGVFNQVTVDDFYLMSAQLWVVGLIIVNSYIIFFRKFNEFNSINNFNSALFSKFEFQCAIFSAIKLTLVFITILLEPKITCHIIGLESLHNHSYGIVVRLFCIQETLFSLMLCYVCFYNDWINSLLNEIGIR